MPSLPQAFSLRRVTSYAAEPAADHHGPRMLARGVGEEVLRPANYESAVLAMFT